MIYELSFSINLRFSISNSALCGLGKRRPSGAIPEDYGADLVKNIILCRACMKELH